MFDNRLNFLVASVVIFMIHLQSLFKRLIDFKTIGIANRNCVLHIYLTWVCPTPKVCFYFLITLQEKSKDSVWFETSITKTPPIITFKFFTSSFTRHYCQLQDHIRERHAGEYRCFCLFWPPSAHQNVSILITKSRWLHKTDFILHVCV